MKWLYLMQSSCRGGMQRVIRSSNLQLIHCTFSAHIWLSTYSITKYTQRTAAATNTRFKHSAYNHVCTHSLYNNNIYMYSSIRDNTHDHLCVRVDHNRCKRKPHKITKNSLSEIFHAMHTVRTYSDTKNDQNITILGAYNGARTIALTS